MEKLKKLFKEYSLRSDLVNSLLGIVLIVALILLFLYPYNRYAILTACSSGGLINISNGLKLMKDPKKTTTGMTFLMMGGILIFVGFFIIKTIDKL